MERQQGEYLDNFEAAKSPRSTNVTLQEWADIVGVKKSYAYEQSRRDAIPGIFRVGKFVRIHLPTFYRAQGIEISGEI